MYSEKTSKVKANYKKTTKPSKKKNKMLLTDST